MGIVASYNPCIQPHLSIGRPTSIAHNPGAANFFSESKPGADALPLCYFQQDAFFYALRQNLN